MKEGTGAYNTDYSNFAPSLGIAWRINAKDGWLKQIVGEGQTVVRAGYSIAYNRQGIGDFRGLASANPGVVITTNRSVALGNLGALPVLFREKRSSRTAGVSDHADLSAHRRTVRPGHEFGQRLRPEHQDALLAILDVRHPARAWTKTRSSKCATSARAICAGGRPTISMR